MNLEKELEKIKEMEKEGKKIAEENLRIMTALNAEERIVVEKEGDKRIIVEIGESGVRDIYMYIPEEWREYEAFQRGPSGYSEQYHREAKVIPLSEEEKRKIMEEHEKEIEEAVERLKILKEYGKTKEELRQILKENNQKADMLRKEIENTPEAKALLKIRTDDMLCECYKIVDPVNKLNYGWNVSYRAIVEALIVTKKENPELFEEVKKYLKEKYNIEIE